MRFDAIVPLILYCSCYPGDGLPVRVCLDGVVRSDPGAVACALQRLAVYSALDVRVLLNRCSAEIRSQAIIKLR